jgi:hypothetical protein
MKTSSLFSYLSQKQIFVDMIGVYLQNLLQRVISMIEIHYTVEEDRGSASVLRQIVDHRGRSVGKTRYGTTVDRIDVFTNFTSCTCLTSNPVYLKAFLKQLKIDGGYLVNGEFKALTLEDECALENHRKIAKGDLRAHMWLNLIYGSIVACILAFFSPIFMIIPLIMAVGSLLLEAYDYSFVNPKRGIGRVLFVIDSIYKIPVGIFYISLLTVANYVLPLLPDHVSRKIAAKLK